MNQRNATTRRRWGVASILALATLAWFYAASDDAPPVQARNAADTATASKTQPSTLHTNDASGSATASDPPAQMRPDYAINENGRLSIHGGSLPKGQALTIGLAIPHDARGDEPVAARIVSVDGRVIDVVANPSAAIDGGLHVAVDTDWLTPGKYMIEIKTIEQHPLALRRYVLEVD